MPPDHPTVEQIEPNLYRWTFNTTDRDEQQRQFNYWCGWFGFDDADEPEAVEGDRWTIRSSLR